MKTYVKIAVIILLSIALIFLINYDVKDVTEEVSTTHELENKLASNSGENNYSGEAKNSGDNYLAASGEKISGDSSTIIAKDNDKKIEKEVKLTSNSPYYIKINNLQNVVTIYKKDAEGNYTEPYKAMICSVGEATPVAGKKHKVTSYKKRWNALQGNVYGQYATQIIGNILFHSVPYTAKRNDALEYWEYDKLGTDASLGCVRLTVEDAKWIYDNIPQGTIVEFYEDINPGPLGKPTAQKISENELCRDWDPTDTAEGNPWNKKVVEIIESGESGEGA